MRDERGMGVLHYEVGNMPRLRPMRALCVNLAGIEDPRRDRFGLTGLHTISVDLNLGQNLFTALRQTC